MSGLVFVFPGQGSQFVGMGRDLAEGYAVARETFAEADRVLGRPLSRLCWEGPEEELRRTSNTQPAILTASVAAWRVLEGAGVAPAYVAGHSLGEYSALVAAGALSFADALVLVQKRGLFMEEAVPAGRGGMAAVLGLPAEAVAEACRKADPEGKVEPANYNCPGQVVIAGEREALERAVQHCKEAGAKRVMPLNVSGPFHSLLMRPAAARLLRELQAVEIRKPRVPVVANVTARPAEDPAEIRVLLGEQVASPVRWEESVRWLAEKGLCRYVEIGPGKVLAGLIKKIAPEALVLNAGDRESLENVLASLEVAG